MEARLKAIEERLAKLEAKTACNCQAELEKAAKDIKNSLAAGVDSFFMWSYDWFCPLHGSKSQGLTTSFPWNLHTGEEDWRQD